MLPIMPASPAVSKSWMSAARSIARDLRRISMMIPERRDPVKISRRAQGHLAGDKQINFTSMVFVVRQAFIYLRARDILKAAVNDAINRFAVLNKSDNVMYTDAGTFDRRASTSNTRLVNDIAVGCARDICGHTHAESSGWLGSWFLSYATIRASPCSDDRRAGVSAPLTSYVALA